eukprot:GHVU01127937.1.p1 GENE.GHVU01127937.1~~GHVU01127937.1.p1  ORF type:complete len:1003 (-),score=110.54 GHVU01127937.1:232-3240(-)
MVDGATPHYHSPIRFDGHVKLGGHDVYEFSCTDTNIHFGYDLAKMNRSMIAMRSCTTAIDKGWTLRRYTIGAKSVENTVSASIKYWSPQGYQSLFSPDATTAETICNKENEIKTHNETKRDCARVRKHVSGRNEANITVSFSHPVATFGGDNVILRLGKQRQQNQAPIRDFSQYSFLLRHGRADEWNKTEYVRPVNYTKGCGIEADEGCLKEGEERCRYSKCLEEALLVPTDLIYDPTQMGPPDDCKMLGVGLNEARDSIRFCTETPARCVHGQTAFKQLIDEQEQAMLAQLPTENLIKGFRHIDGRFRITSNLTWTFHASDPGVREHAKKANATMADNEKIIFYDLEMDKIPGVMEHKENYSLPVYMELMQEMQDPWYAEIQAEVRAQTVSWIRTNSPGIIVYMEPPVGCTAWNLSGCPVKVYVLNGGQKRSRYTVSIPGCFPSDQNVTDVPCKEIRTSYASSKFIEANTTGTFTVMITTLYSSEQNVSFTCNIELHDSTGSLIDVEMVNITMGPSLPDSGGSLGEVVQSGDGIQSTYDEHMAHAEYFYDCCTNGAYWRRCGCNLLQIFCVLLNFAACIQAIKATICSCMCALIPIAIFASLCQVCAGPMLDMCTFGCSACFGVCCSCCTKCLECGCKCCCKLTECSCQACMLCCELGCKCAEVGCKECAVAGKAGGKCAKKAVKAGAKATSKAAGEVAGKARKTCKGCTEKCEKGCEQMCASCAKGCGIFGAGIVNSFKGCGLSCKRCCFGMLKNCFHCKKVAGHISRHGLQNTSPVEGEEGTHKFGRRRKAGTYSDSDEEGEDGGRRRKRRKRRTKGKAEEEDGGDSKRGQKPGKEKGRQAQERGRQAQERGRQPKEKRGRQPKNPKAKAKAKVNAKAKGKAKAKGPPGATAPAPGGVTIVGESSSSSSSDDGGTTMALVQAMMLNRQMQMGQQQNAFRMQQMAQGQQQGQPQWQQQWQQRHQGQQEQEEQEEQEDQQEQQEQGQQGPQKRQRGGRRQA